MMQALISLSIRHRLTVAVLGLLVLAFGIGAMFRAPLDVFPEFVAVQVTVQTEAPGMSPEQVEQLVTRPVEAALNGAPGLDTIRSESIPGLSAVTLSFKEGIDLIAVRQGVAEHLSEVATRLPSGVAAPKMSPLTSSTMDLLKIGLLSTRVGPYELRELADFSLKPRLLAVAGVARITVYGGDVRQMQIQFDAGRLRAAGVSLTEMVSAAQSAIGIRGGGFIDLPAQRLTVSTEAVGRTAIAIGETVITSKGGVAIHLSDVADVVEGPAVKAGDALIQGKPGVLLSISGQYGANTLEATRAVEAALAEMRPQLAALGVTVVSPLHRPANFIEHALKDLGQTLVVGSLLILALLVLFLRNWRVAFISFVTIPLSLLAAVIVLEARGVTITTLTLGGFAVALGVLVDDAIIDIENVLRRVRLNAEAAVPREWLEVVIEASVEIRGAVFYATLIVLVVFLPVLAMGGVQGRLLAPLAEAFLLAVLASLGVALTVTPALCSLLLRGRAESHQGWFAGLSRLQRTAMVWVDRHLQLVMALLLVALVGIALRTPYLGGEFFPTFREGHFVLQVSAKQPGTSLAEMLRVGGSISDAVLKLPYVATVSQQVGRAEQGEDTWGPHRSEFHVELKPDAQIEQLVAQQELRNILEAYPALQLEVLTFLGDRISETLTGETAQVVVNLVGPDLDALDRLAQQLARIASAVDGVVDLSANVQSGVPQLDVRLDPDRLAFYGIRPMDALEAVATGYAGQTVGQIYNQDRVIDVVTILPAALRGRPESIAALPLMGIDGTQVPLATVASIEPATGRYSIRHEGGRRRVAVTFNVEGRPATQVVSELRTRVRRDLRLPAATFVEFGGVAEAQGAAQRDLWLYSGLAFAFIVLCLGLAFRQRMHVPMVLLNMPFALIGSIVAISITGIGISLGSLVGLVTVFGISARNALLLLAHYEHLVSVEGLAWSSEVAWRGAEERLRPVLMTALVTALGLVPLALGIGKAGHEIESPMAITVLGGLATSTVLTLLVLPAIARRYSFKSLLKEAA